MSSETGRVERRAGDKEGNTSQHGDDANLIPGDSFIGAMPVSASNESTSPFERDNHNLRYTSYVLDVDKGEEHENQSLSSHQSDQSHRSNIGTTEWFRPERREAQWGDEIDVDDSSQSSGMSNIWQKQHSQIDQSINLMDADAAHYQEPPFQTNSSGLESLKGGLQNLYKPSTTSNISYQNQTGKQQNQKLVSSWNIFQRQKKTRRISKQKKPSPQTFSKSSTFLIFDSRKRIILGVCLLSMILAIIAILYKHTTNGNDSHGALEVLPFRDKETAPEDIVVDGASDKILVSSKTSAQPPDSAKKHTSSSQFEVIPRDVDIHPTVSLPAKTRSQAIIAILLEYKVSTSESLFQSKESAQYQALKWISEDDPAQSPIPRLYYSPPEDDSNGQHHSATLMEHASDEFTLQQVLQRYVLAVFYFNLQPFVVPDSSSSASIDTEAVAKSLGYFRKSWLSEDHVCHWHGLDCGIYNKNSVGAEIESIHMSTVVGLNLTGHHLNATWPQELFVGAAMPDLRSVDLSHNYLAGPISPFGISAVSGPTRVSTSLGNYYLHFKHNSSRPDAPEFPDSSSLIYLDVSHNHLSGALPAILQHIPDCSIILLNHNQFTGPLESLLENTTESIKLTEVLDIGSNLLTGTVPNALINMQSLKYLSFQENFISGSVPEHFHQLNNLVELHANDNILEGILPASMGSLTGIETLRLEHNEFVGSIPTSWSAMTALELLSLNHNTIDGEIPTFFGTSMLRLTDLLLSNNQLEGSIPPEIGNCNALKRLLLFGNRLTGVMDPSICQLLKDHELEYLSADCTSGHIQCECCNACF